MFEKDSKKDLEMVLNSKFELSGMFYFTEI